MLELGAEVTCNEMEHSVSFDGRLGALSVHWRSKLPAGEEQPASIDSSSDELANDRCHISCFDALRQGCMFNHTVTIQDALQ